MVQIAWLYTIPPAERRFRRVKGMGLGWRDVPTKNDFVDMFPEIGQMSCLETRFQSSLPLGVSKTFAYVIFPFYHRWQFIEGGFVLQYVIE